MYNYNEGNVLDFQFSVGSVKLPEAFNKKSVKIFLMKIGILIFVFDLNAKA